MFRVLFLILVVMTSILLAQTQDNSLPNSQQKSYIIGEFGKANDSGVKNQFEKFDEELKKDFYSQGSIINYGTDKEVAKREKQLRNSIVFRNYDASRITLVRGSNNGKL